MTGNVSTTLMAISLAGLVIAWIGYRKVKKILDEAKGKQIKNKQKQNDVRLGLALEITGIILAAIFGTIGIIMKF